MNALVVGAGSVGQDFAHHLHLGGSEISFLTRTERAPEMGRDLLLIHLNKRNARMNPIHFGSFDVLTRYSQLESRSWNKIYMCIPSTSLTDGLLDGIKTYGGAATIVKIQPGPGDWERFTEHFDVSQIVSGMVSFISYRAPLGGETVAEPGMAYWFPPLVRSMFSGLGDRVRGVVSALQAGGLPARAHPDVENLVSYIVAVEAPLTAGIQSAGWSLRRFNKSRWLKVACRGIKEALQLAGKHQQSNAPIFTQLVNCLTIRLAIWFLPKERVFPLEPYLEHHFMKLRSQSLQHLDDYLEQALKYDIEVGSLNELRNAIASGDAAE